MNSKRKILLSLFLVFVLAASASIASASEDADDQISSSSIDDSINSDLDSADLSLNSGDTLNNNLILMIQAHQILNLNPVLGRIFSQAPAVKL